MLVLDKCKMIFCFLVQASRLDSSKQNTNNYDRLTSGFRIQFCTVSESNIASMNALSIRTEDRHVFCHPMFYYLHETELRIVK